MQEQIRELSDEQLVHQVLQAQRDLVALKFQHSMSALENTAQLGEVRKYIARLKTIARQREIEQGLAKNHLIDQHRKTFTAEGAPEAPAGEEGSGFLSGIVDRLTGKE